MKILPSIILFSVGIKYDASHAFVPANYKNVKGYSTVFRNECPMDELISLYLPKKKLNSALYMKRNRYKNGKRRKHMLWNVLNGDENAVIDEKLEKDNVGTTVSSNFKSDMYANRFASGYISDGYSRSLNRRKSILDPEEDGYSKMFGKKKRVFWKKMLLAPIKLARKVLDGKTEPGTLILVRHGESLWNANKTFTGWADPDLSETGHREVEHAARLLLEGGYEIDVVFTSRLTRAIRSTWILLQELNEVHIPVFKSWRLNERMYGALTGLSKKETAEKLGASLVQRW